MHYENIFLFVKRNLLFIAFFWLILFQCFNLLSLEGLYSEDDYWIRNTFGGHQIQSLIDSANGRFVVGQLIGVFDERMYELITGVAGRVLAIISLLIFLFFLGKVLFGKNPVAIVGFASIAFLHPYWIELFRFNLLLPGVVIASFALLLAVRLSRDDKIIPLLVAATFLFVSMGVYQPYLYVYSAFILMMAFLHPDTWWRILIRGFLVILIACATYFLVYTYFKPIWISEIKVHNSPIASQIVSDRGGFLIGKELLISLAESFYHGIRTLFLEDGVTAFYMKMLTLLVFLVALKNAYRNNDKDRLASVMLLGVFAFGFIWLSSSPIHGLVKEDHYAFRSMVQASILIAFIYVYVSLSTRFRSVLLVSISAVFAISSFAYVKNITNLYESHIRLSHEVEAEYRKQGIAWDIYKIETPQRYTKQFQEAHKKTPYIFSPLWHTQTRFEFLKSHTSLPVRRFAIAGDQLPACKEQYDKEFWFVTSKEHQAAILCFKSDPLDAETQKSKMRKLKQWLKSI